MMKPKVLISIAGLTALIAGFVLFLTGIRNLAVVFTLIGIFVYLYSKKSDAQSSQL